MKQNRTKTLFRINQSALWAGIGLLGIAIALPLENSRAVDWLDDLPVVGKNKDDSPTTAASTSSTQPAAPRIHEAKQAVVRVLDKQTNRVQTLTLNLKQERVVGTLSVSVNRCLLDSNGRPGVDAGWFVIKDTALSDKGFEGWMFSRYPQAATLDNPRYDVQLASCVLPAGEQRLQAAPAPAGAGQGTGGEDVEGGGDDEAPAGGGGGSATTPRSNDPFFVPGVTGNGTGSAQPAQQDGDGDNAQVGEPASEAPVRSERAEQQPSPGADAGVELPTEPAPRRERGGDQQQLQQMMDNGGGAGGGDGGQ